MEIFEVKNVKKVQYMKEILTRSPTKNTFALTTFLFERKVTFIYLTDSDVQTRIIEKLCFYSELRRYVPNSKIWIIN